MGSLCPNLTENEKQLVAAFQSKDPYPEKFQAVMLAFYACLTDIKELRLRRLCDWHAKRSGEFRRGHWEDVRQEMLLKAIEHLTKQTKGEASYVFDGRTTFVRYLAGCYDSRNVWRKRQKEKDLFVEWPFDVDNGGDIPDVEDNSQLSATVDRKRFATVFDRLPPCDRFLFALAEGLQGSPPSALVVSDFARTCGLQGEELRAIEERAIGLAWGAKGREQEQVKIWELAHLLAMPEAKIKRELNRIKREFTTPRAPTTGKAA